MKPNALQNILPALVLGVAIIGSTAIGSSTFYATKAFGNSLSVTGSAKQQVTSDQVKWVSSVSRSAYANALPAGYTQLARDVAAVKAFFVASGIPETAYNVSPVFMDQIYKQYEGPVKEYTLRQTIELNSSEVDKVTALAKGTQSLIDKGVFFSTQSLEYSYSKLADLRVSLLADAIRDAKARAEQIAKSSDTKVGGLISASSGVVQVLPVNSVDVSDYGSYDMSGIEKQVMVSVRAAFSVK